MFSLGVKLRDALEDAGEKAVLNDAGRMISGTELNHRVELMSEMLVTHKVQRLGVYMENSADWIAADIACLINQVVMVPIPHFFSVQQKNHIVQDARIVSILKHTNRSDPWTMTLSAQSFVLSNCELLKLNAQSLEPTAQIPNCTAKITYTSGSTGAPKGVCLSHKLLSDTTTSLHDVLADFEVERHLSVMPYSTLLENMAGIYVAILSGAVIFSRANESLGLLPSMSIDAQRFAQTVNEIRPNSLIVTPQLLTLICELKRAEMLDLSSLSFVAVGGAACALSLLEKAWQLGIPVFQGYGLSECGSVVSLSGQHSNVLGKVGKVLPHVQVNIDGSGEIIVSGNEFGRYLHSSGDFPSMIATGDLGQVDELGYLSIAGRRKNLIILSTGRNVSPEWVESELLQQPEIAQCVAYGDGCEVVEVLIVPARSDIDRMQIDQAVLRANRTLPLFAQVSSWRYAEPFTTQNKQLTNTGKLKRGQILTDYAGINAEQIQTVVSLNK